MQSCDGKLLLAGLIKVLLTFKMYHHIHLFFMRKIIEDFMSIFIVCLFFGCNSQNVDPIPSLINKYAIDI